MGFEFKDLEGSQAADVNQALVHLTGYGFVEGGTPSEGARPFAVDVLDAKTYVGGELVETEATTINLQDYARDLNNPRKVVIYIDGDGEFAVAAGKPARPKPTRKYRFETFRPSPPDFHDREGVPVVEVWIGRNSQHITDEDIRDRRLNAAIDAHLMAVETVSFNTLIDGSGTERETLSLVEDQTTVENARQTIYDDTDHGSLSSHQYYSGSHDDLVDIYADAHHPRYTTQEAYDAINGQVDLADLGGADYAYPGTYLSIGGESSGYGTLPYGQAYGGGDSTSEGPLWQFLPMSQAPQIETGTVTHTGGSSTTVTISDVTPLQTAGFDIDTTVSVDSSPSWSADYSYSVDETYTWDETDDAVDIELTFTWDTDPGSGNDLTLRYRIHQRNQSAVRMGYTDKKAVDVLAGRDLSVSGLGVSTQATIPGYTDTADAPSASTGDILSSTDAEGNQALFIHDGSSWTGPYTTGVTALSGLEIDGSKDWFGYELENVGEPTTADGMARQSELDDHDAAADAHHAKVVSSDIDHGQMGNVQVDQHHSRYTDAETLESVLGYTRDITIGATVIPHKDEVRAHVAIASDEEMKLLHASVLDDDGTRPSGLNLELEDLESGDILHREFSRIAEGTLDDPLFTVSGPATLAFRLRNSTGSVIAASAEASYLLS